MKYTTTAYVAILLKSDLQQIVIRMDRNRAYVWDAVFADARERFGYDSIPDGGTRAAAMKAARRIGYDVLQGTLTCN